jgi:hypothetical protein
MHLVVITDLGTPAIGVCEPSHGIIELEWTVIHSHAIRELDTVCKKFSVGKTTI